MSYPPSSNLLDHYLYTRENTSECICEGTGAFQMMLAPTWKTLWVVEPSGPVDYTVSYQTYACVWHSEEGRSQINYPDGWDTKALTRWCKQHNVPLPPNLRPRKVSIGEFKDYVGWDTQQYANYGKATIADKLWGELPSINAHNYLTYQQLEAAMQPNTVTYNAPDDPYIKAMVQNKMDKTAKQLQDKIVEYINKWIFGADYEPAD